MGKKASKLRMAGYIAAMRIVKESGDDGLSPTAKRLMDLERCWVDPSTSRESVGGCGGCGGLNGSAVVGVVAGGEELRPAAHAADAAHAAGMQDDNTSPPGGDTSAAFADPGAERLMYASVLM